MQHAQKNYLCSQIFTLASRSCISILAQNANDRLRQAMQSAKETFYLSLQAEQDAAAAQERHLLQKIEALQAVINNVSEEEGLHLRIQKTRQTRSAAPPPKVPPEIDSSRDKIPSNEVLQPPSDLTHDITASDPVDLSSVSSAIQAGHR
jgi:hypothetical protein